MSLIEEVSPRGDPRVISAGLLVLILISIVNIALQVSGKMDSTRMLLFYVAYIAGFLIVFYGYRRLPPKRYFFEEE